jgi:hypothetical protein
MARTMARCARRPRRVQASELVDGHLQHAPSSRARVACATRASIRRPGCYMRTCVSISGRGGRSRQDDRAAPLSRPDDVAPNSARARPASPCLPAALPQRQSPPDPAAHHTQASSSGSYTGPRSSGRPFAPTRSNRIEPSPPQTSRSPSLGRARHCAPLPSQSACLTRLRLTRLSERYR